MKRRNDFPVIQPDGTITLLPPGNLFDNILRHVGSPFDHTILYQDGEIMIDAYVRDEGLFDGSQPCWPILAVFGAPICGPVLLLGGADDQGNSLTPWDHPAVDSVLRVAATIGEAVNQIEANREQPFSVYSFEIDEIKTILGDES